LVNSDVFCFGSFEFHNLMIWQKVHNHEYFSWARSLLKAELVKAKTWIEMVLKADLRYFESLFRTNYSFLNNATYKFKHTHLFTINVFYFIYKMFSEFNVLMQYIFWGFFSFVDFINQCKYRRFNSFQYVKIFLDSLRIVFMIFMISWFCQSSPNL